MVRGQRQARGNEDKEENAEGDGGERRNASEARTEPRTQPSHSNHIFQILLPGCLCWEGEKEGGKKPFVGMVSGWDFALRSAHACI